MAVIKIVTEKGLDVYRGAPGEGGGRRIN